MGGNAGELQLGSERELYNMSNINHHAGTTKASIKIILIQVYNIFRLLIGVPNYSSDVMRQIKTTRAPDAGACPPPVLR